MFVCIHFYILFKYAIYLFIIFITLLYLSLSRHNILNPVLLYSSSIYFSFLYSLHFYTLLFFDLLYFVYSSIPYMAILLYIVIFKSISILCFQGIHKETTGRAWCATEEADLAGLDVDFNQRYCPHGNRSSVPSLHTYSKKKRTHLPSVRSSRWLYSACCWGAKWRMQRELVHIHLSNQLQTGFRLGPDVPLILRVTPIQPAALQKCRCISNAFMKKSRCATDYLNSSLAPNLSYSTLHLDLVALYPAFGVVLEKAFLFSSCRSRFVCLASICL